MKRVISAFVGLVLLLSMPQVVESSRVFVVSESDVLSVATPAVTAAPITIAAWFNSTNDAAVRTIACIVSNTAGADSAFRLMLRGDQAGDPIAAQVTGSAAQGDALSTTGFSLSTWHSAVAVFTSTTSRTIYLDGGSSATDTTDVTPGSLTHTLVGGYYNNGADPVVPQFDGQIAEVGIWDVALSAAEVAALAKGIPPPLVRSQSLVAYWPLIGRASPESDVIGGSNLTVTGAVVGDHPRVFGLGQ